MSVKRSRGAGVGERGLRVASAELSVEASRLYTDSVKNIELRSHNLKYMLRIFRMLTVRPKRKNAQFSKMLPTADADLISHIHMSRILTDG